MFLLTLWWCELFFPHVIKKWIERGGECWERSLSCNELEMVEGDDDERGGCVRWLIPQLTNMNKCASLVLQ